MIPIPKVSDEWDRIMEDRHQLPGCVSRTAVLEFLGYFTDTYFEGSFPIEVWNHFETRGEPRTNNHLEGYNLRLRKCVGNSDPHIFKAIGILKKEELNSSVAYYAAKDGTQKPPKRRKKWIDSDNKVRLFRDQWLAGHFRDFQVYISSIMSVMFITIEKPKISTVVDDDEDVVSDSEIFNDSEPEDEMIDDDETDNESGIGSGNNTRQSLLSTQDSLRRSVLNGTSPNTVSCDCNNAKCATVKFSCKRANIQCTNLCHYNSYHSSCKRMNYNEQRNYFYLCYYFIIIIMKLLIKHS